MGDAKGFLKTKRRSAGYRAVGERLRDYQEVEARLPQEDVRQQASRCMDCGVPFCHNACSMANVIPDFNDLIFRGRWEEALSVLHATNNFPEFTGRLCPALCEAACTLGINDEPVTIRENEVAIVEWGFGTGMIKPFIPRCRTDRRVAVVGSGPAGMACGQQLTRAGHTVTLFEADAMAGGLLRYGIPDFKLEKRVIDRRLKQLQEEGLVLKTGVRVGADIASDRLAREYDAICLCVGSRQPRELAVEGRGLTGICQALDYLTQSNKRQQGMRIPEAESLVAKDKDVIVIGGGDTGADCVGTANRQGARSVTQIELLQAPPEVRTKDMPWPTFPKLLKTTSSHQEGCLRLWGVATKKFSGEAGAVRKLHGVKVDEGFKEIPGSGFELKCDLVILAMGFTHPAHEGLLKDLGLNLDRFGNISTNNFSASVPKIFAAGDARRGASLVVWAIAEGRGAAREIDRFLMGQTNLP
ncbi:MAG: glutamate synthase subunit beta [Candidatus Omnitrophota bacterium]